LRARLRTARKPGRVRIRRGQSHGVIKNRFRGEIMKVNNEQFNNLIDAMLKDCAFLEIASTCSPAYIKAKNLLIENLKFQGFEVQ
jgi:hypothetical protein